MNRAVPTRLHIIVSASVTALACALLLGLPASVLDLGPSGVVVGLSIGTVLGTSALSGRVSLPCAGAILGALTGLTISFGYEGGSFGTNLYWMDGHMSLFLNLIAVFASIGAVSGFAQKTKSHDLSHTLMLPLGALVPILCAPLWEVTYFSICALVDGQECWRPYWRYELVIAIFATIVLHFALYYFCKRRSHRLERILFWISWLCWPALVALTFSLLWMLNHNIGYFAWNAIRGARMFMFGLFSAALISNAVVAMCILRLGESMGVLKTCGLILTVTTVQIASSKFLAFDMLSAHT
jgi:hypothetical protein